MTHEIIAAEMFLNGKEISACKYILDHGLNLDTVRNLVFDHCPNKNAMGYFIARAWDSVCTERITR